jgi:hypothetical protein
MEAICLDRNELKKFLKKQAKPDLLILISDLIAKSPDFQIDPTYISWNPDRLKTSVWEILCGIKEENEDHFEECIEIITKKKHSVKKTEEESESEKIIQPITRKAFSAEETCKHIYDLLTDDPEFVEAWNQDKIYYGFLEFIASNDISLPVNLSRMLFSQVFEIGEEFDEMQTLEYNRYELEEWEEELRQIFAQLDEPKRKLILSLHLIFAHIKRILEKKLEKINYAFIDIPLLKRVIIAQYSKLENAGYCDDEVIEETTANIIEILNCIDDDSRIVMVPWGEID